MCCYRKLKFLPYREFFFHFLVYLIYPIQIHRRNCNNFSFFFSKMTLHKLDPFQSNKKFLLIFPSNGESEKWRGNDWIKVQLIVEGVVHVSIGLGCPFQCNCLGCLFRCKMLCCPIHCKWLGCPVQFQRHGCPQDSSISYVVGQLMGINVTTYSNCSL